MKDILVIAPYNAQLAVLRKALPSDAHVGTVDKFQGQKAPVVTYWSSRRSQVAIRAAAPCGRNHRR